MTEIEKEETKNTFEIANIIKQSNISLGDTPVYAIADLLSKASYRKQSETVKEFVVKAEQRFIEDSKWLDIMLKGYDCKDSEDYDAVANAIIRGRFVNWLNDLATEYGKEVESERLLYC